MALSLPQTVKDFSREHEKETLRRYMNYMVEKNKHRKSLPFWTKRNMDIVSKCLGIGGPAFDLQDVGIIHRLSYSRIREIVLEGVKRYRSHDWHIANR